jgi:hypothetical protein
LLIVSLALIAAGTGVALYFGESAKQMLDKVRGGFLTTETTLRTEELLLYSASMD